MVTVRASAAIAPVVYPAALAADPGSAWVFRLVESGGGGCGGVEGRCGG